MVVPYTKGLSKSFKNVYGKVGVQVHLRGQHHQEPPGDSQGQGKDHPEKWANLKV